MKYSITCCMLLPFFFAGCGDTAVGGVDIKVKTDAIADTGVGTDASQDATGDTAVGDTEGDASDASTDAGCDPTSEFACTEAGASQCNPDGDGVERCQEVGGCLVWANAETCTNLNKCTGVADICLAGACVPPEGAPDPNASCDAPSNSCVQVYCDPADGFCKEQPVSNEAICDDNNVCTENDFCFDGECMGGENACPMMCALNDLGCGTSIITHLGDEGLNTMDAYGCAEGETVFTGSERVFKLQSQNFDCTEELGGGAIVTIEFDNPEDVGVNTVGVIRLDDSNHAISATSCWPSECTASSVMTETGLVELKFDLIQGEQYYVVVDGVDGYNGKVRVSASCCGQSTEICSNGVDDNKIDGKDCQDPACADSGLCDFEFNCTDGIDNDENGLMDCLDAACAGSDECNLEYNCTDGIDDDNDGKIDCDDTDCASSDDCAAACENAQLLTCDGVAANQELTAADVVQLATVGNGDQCNPEAAYATEEGHLQKFYKVVPNCEGEYTVTVDAIDGGFFDVHFLKASCSEDAVCADSGATWVSNSYTFKTDAFPSVWAGVMTDYLSPVISTGQYSVSVSCECNP